MQLQSLIFFKTFYLFVVLGLRCCAGFLQLLRVGATLCGDAWASRCGGFSCCRAQALGMQTSIVVVCGLSSCGMWVQEHFKDSKFVAHELSRHVVCGIFLDQILNQCLLHWQADCLPLDHQRSPTDFLKINLYPF